MFVSSSGATEVQKTIDRFNDQTAEHFKAAVRYLAAAPREDWRRPNAAKLRHYAELFEIRFKSGGTQWRPTGFFGPEPGVFTITVICTEKQDVYSPRDAFDTADNRRRLLIKGEARTAPLQVDGEDFPPVPD